jgi:hypothetical protein
LRGLSSVVHSGNVSCGCGASPIPSPQCIDGVAGYETVCIGLAGAGSI